MEKELSKKMNFLDMEDIREKVAEWVQDMGLIAGHLSTYGNIIYTYWEIKGLMSLVLMERENKVVVL